MSMEIFAPMSSAFFRYSPLAAGRTDLPLRGLCFGLAAAFFVSSQDAIIKFLSSDTPILQIIFVRAAIGCALAAVWILRTRNLSALHSRRPALAAVRVCCMVTASWAYYIALSLLDLAVYTCLGLTVFLFVSALSGPVLKEKFALKDWLAVCAGLIGVVIIINPSADSPIHLPAAALLLCGALLWAAGIVATRALGTALSASGLLFYSNGALLLSAAFVPLLPFFPSFEWRALSPPDWSLLLLLGCFGVCGQGLAIAAYRNARIGAVIPTQHTMLLWAAFFAWLLWDEIPDIRLWCGGALIIGASLAALPKRRSRSSS